MDMNTECFEKRGVDMDMDTEIFENRGVDMEVDTEFVENRGMDMDMDTAWNRCPPNSGCHHHIPSLTSATDTDQSFEVKLPGQQLLQSVYQSLNLTLKVR